MDAFGIVVALVPLGVIVGASFAVILVVVLPVVAVSRLLRRSQDPNRAGPVVTSLKWSGALAAVATAVIGFRILVFPFVDGHDLPPGLVSLGEVSGCEHDVISDGIAFAPIEKSAESCSGEMPTSMDAWALLIYSETGCVSGRFTVSVDIRLNAQWNVRTRQHPGALSELVILGCGQSATPHIYAFELGADTHVPDLVQVHRGWGTAVQCYHRNAEWEASTGPC